MAEAIRVSAPISGTDKTLSFETGKLAQQSMGAVVASLGGTTVLATANAANAVNALCSPRIRKASAGIRRWICNASS
jgi:hypothetical protein